MKVLVNVALAGLLILGCASRVSALDLGNLVRNGLQSYVSGNYGSGYGNGYVGNGYLGNAYGNGYNANGYYGNGGALGNGGVLSNVLNSGVLGNGYSPYYGNSAYSNGTLKSQLLNQAANVLMQMF